MKHTRRVFLSSLLATPAAVTLDMPRFGLLAAPAQSRPWRRFENPGVIRYDASCFTINGRDVFLFGAEFHYPRCPRELWQDRFLKLRRAGFTTIETMVFWNYHEREEGRFDFSELEAFLKLAQEMGFWVIVRPGPYICAEFERAGFPRWIIAKRFPLRSMHPESLKTSKYWYDHVMPVIRAHQITSGGPIILMQIENEYDFWNLPAPEKREYVRFLAQTAWQAGIDVPLFTNWTKVVRSESDPDMDRIMDTCDFYPRWDFLKEVPPALEKLRKEKAHAPLGIAELQGGWFSQIGGRLSVDQEGVEAAQLNALTKTVFELGVTYFNYYMGYGGNNFDWAAKTLTTTYDYAAPIREPGGLWDKYYAARGLGEFLKTFGPLLLRSQVLPDACQSTNPEVSVSERINGSSALLFVRANTEAEHHFRMTVRDPMKPAERPISIPRKGELVMGPREMKVLPIQVPLMGWQLRYSTAEYLAHGVVGDRTFLLVYDEPGRTAEIALSSSEEPQLHGDTSYVDWIKDDQCLVIGLRFETKEKFVLVNDRLLLVALPTSVALRTWVAEFPAGAIPGSKGSSPAAVPFITDAYFLAESDGKAQRAWGELDFLPGTHAITTLLPSKPSQVRADGKTLDFDYDPQFQSLSVRLSTPASHYKGVELKDLQVSRERFEASSGHWTTTPLRALEDLGPVPYGYVKYRASMVYSHERKMFISTFADDFKRVFLNGHEVVEASNSDTFIEFSAAGYLRPGPNTVEVSYEAFGSPNGDDNMGELKGVEFVRLGSDPQTALDVGSWEIQTFPVVMRDRGVDMDASFGGWEAATVPGTAIPRELVPAFTWCRAEFTLKKVTEGWTVPW